MRLPLYLVCCFVATAVVACGGSGSADVAPAPPAAPKDAGATTGEACRTFEDYSHAFAEHANRDARAQNLYRLIQDVSTLQAAVGVALYNMRDGQINQELQTAKRATDALLNDQRLGRSKHAFERDFLMLIAAQTKIKRSCQEAPQRPTA